jgi:hypothetical protein
MILEGLLTTTLADGQPHVAPMGPAVDPELTQWQLRPFQGSTTCDNLLRSGIAVFHVMDDVLPIVQSALSLPVDLHYRRSADGGWVIESCCHWYSLKLQQWDLSQPRAIVSAQVQATGIHRSFWGWNRAKHAILEATILATRLNLTGRDAVVSQLQPLENAVIKTAGPRELLAWQLVEQYIRFWQG